MTALTKIGLGLLLFFSFSVKGQPFGWKAKLEPVSASGFYQLRLRTDVLAVAKSDLADLRLLDDKGRNVAFIIRQPNTEGAEFIRFPILQTATDSLFTTVQLNAGAIDGSDHVYLIMANTNVERRASVSGSNDGKSWYIIKDDVVLTNTAQTSSDKFVQLLQYPFNRYRFLKLKIDNQKTDPVHIVNAGVYNQNGTNGNQSYIENDPTSFTQKDSGNKTYLFIQQQKPFVIDRIKLTVSGPPFFKRQAIVYTASNGEKSKSLLTTFELSSAKEPVVNVPSIKTTKLWIEIENVDNTPLSFTAVSTEVLQRYMIAYLQKGKDYFLAAGNEKAAAPNFDLAHFRDSIGAALPVINYGVLIAQNNNLKEENSNYNWLWPAIILMMLALAALTFRLLKDVKQKEV